MRRKNQTFVINCPFGDISHLPYSNWYRISTIVER